MIKNMILGVILVSMLIDAVKFTLYSSMTKINFHKLLTANEKGQSSIIKLRYIIYLIRSLDTEIYCYTLNLTGIFQSVTTGGYPNRTCILTLSGVSFSVTCEQHAPLSYDKFWFPFVQMMFGAQIGFKITKECRIVSK